MKRKHVSQPFEWRASDDEWGDEPRLEDDFNAEHTTHFAQPEERAQRKRPAYVDDEPRVPLHEHFIERYNETMNKRYPVDEADEEESVASGDEAQQLIARPPAFADLFESLGAGVPHTAPRAPRPYDKRTRPECFMCAFGNRYHDGIEAKHRCRMDEIMDMYGGCDNEELAEMLVLYYDRHVYRTPDGRVRPGMSRFTRQVALEHIKHHTKDAVIFLGESVDLLLEIRFGMADIIFKKNGRHDKDALAGFINVQKLLNTQMTMKPENMIFNFGKSAEDTRRMGRRFNFMECFKQKKERQEREWRAEHEADDLFDV